MNLPELSTRHIIQDRARRASRMEALGRVRVEIDRLVLETSQQSLDIAFEIKERVRPRRLIDAGHNRTARRAQRNLLPLQRRRANVLVNLAAPEQAHVGNAA